MKYRNEPTIACHYVVQCALHHPIPPAQNGRVVGISFLCFSVSLPPSELGILYYSLGLLPLSPSELGTWCAGALQYLSVSGKWTDWTIRNEGQHVWSFSSSEVMLIFLLALFAGGFLLAKTCPHCPSHRWVNHSKTYYPYPERMYNLVAAFYPLFSRLQFRHSSSFADSCACTDALCGRDVIRSSVRVLVPSPGHQQALIFLQLADGSDAP